MPRVPSPQRLGALALAFVLLAAAAAGAQFSEPPPGSAPPRDAQIDENPCIAAPRDLLCPDLVMRAPYDLRIDKRTKPGRRLLRAANSIDSRGRGPAELRGRRTGRVTMAARQAIYRADGSRMLVDTGARLGFKFVPGRRVGSPDVGDFYYWKFRDAARFELWSLNELGERAELVRRGPKVYYCLRDLQRTRRSRISPRREVYPACSQKRKIDRVTLGTSVGWSDIYPASYPEQYIDITGLRGDFAYVHIADPRNGIFESNEDNNESEVIVRLPSGRVLGEREGISGDPPVPGAPGGGAPAPGY